MCVSLNFVLWESWWYLFCGSLSWCVPMGPGSSLQHAVQQTVFQVNVIRTSMIFYGPSTVQTHPCHRLVLQELKSIFSTTMSQVFGPCQAAALGPASLSQPLSLLLWLHKISAPPWMSGQWSGFCSSSCSCPPHSVQSTRLLPLQPPWAPAYPTTLSIFSAA